MLFQNLHELINWADGAAAPFRTPVSTTMSSDEVFKLAVTWYKKCKCAKQRPDWHPTRLIDIRNLKARVVLEGARTIPKGQLEWARLDSETVRIVKKGDEQFPLTGEPPKPQTGNSVEAPEDRNTHNYPIHPHQYDNRYVTLSHCWGDRAHRPMVLNKDTMTELEKGVELRKLPNTYKQAIQFAAQMEYVGWIWIDSLCIIQDDKDDWTHESSDMQRVYHESFLNISATASRDSTENLYRDRNPKTLWEDEINLKVDGIHGLERKSVIDPVASPFPSPVTDANSKSSKICLFSSLSKWLWPVSERQPYVKVTNDAQVKRVVDTPSPRQEGIRRCILVDLSHWDDLINNAPVNIRAWVLQERLLAPRVLHFGKSQIAWECEEFEESEGYPTGTAKFLMREDRILPKPLVKGLKGEHGRELRKIRLQGEPEPDPHLVDKGLYELQLWSRIVEDYSKLDLSEGSDKLVALSGIARHMAEQGIDSSNQPAIYVAGLWDKYLASQLLWKIEPTFQHHDRAFKHPSRRPRDSNGDLIYRAPSFSWASVDAQAPEYGHGIVYGEITDKDLLIEVDSGRDSVCIKQKIPRNPYGEVKGGHIMVWGQLRKARLVKDDKENKGRYYWYLQDRGDVCPPDERHEFESEEHRNVYLDCPEDDKAPPVLGTDDVYCMPAALGSRMNDKGSKYIICLMLQQVSERDEEIMSLGQGDRRWVYRRIGLTKLSTWADKRAYQYIRKPSSTDRGYPQRPHHYDRRGGGKSLIRII